MKVGRKRNDHIDSNTGLPIVGLARRPSDGRWRVIGTQITFTEPNEQKAIQRFQELTGSSPEQQSFQRAVDNQQMGLSGPQLWRYVAQQINERPKWVAKQTGIEWLAYGAELKPPAPLPSLKTLEENWETHAKCSPLQIKKVLRGWRDFKETMSLVGLRDITPELVVEYQDKVHARGLSGKQQSHLFGGVRRMLNFNRKRAVAVPEITKILAHLEILEPSESAINLDPRPIDVAEWKKLLGRAEGDDKAMVLLMLNCALYLQETITLEWADIKSGCLVTRREKTGKCIRVAVLWQETIDALAALPRKGENLFYTYQGLPIKICGAQRRFAALTKAAGVKVTASQLRDGAYTAAVDANITTALCKLLMGHASGIADHYVLRKPSMVQPATDAVYAAYMT